jgi:uncharacterized protein
MCSSFRKRHAVALPEHLASLLLPEAFDHPISDVQVVETNICWVLLTGEYAYKIKRPVVYPFVNLCSLERRAFLCAEEVRLNRRFAPELYLGVVPITVSGGRARFGGTGEAIELAVRMRQFRREDELDRLLVAGKIAPEELADFGRELARIHEKSPVVDRAQAYGSAAFVRHSLEENVRQCIQLSARANAADRVRAVEPLIAKQLEAAETLISTRREAGRVRECHGDLHTRNVVRHEGRLVAFDCMEFEPAFRWIDVSEEIAFLFMDVSARGHKKHATAFLNGYLAESGDFQACRLVKLYGAHRALVRAKVAALQADGTTECLSYIQCAADLLESQKPKLVLMSGVSGSGKTWLAERLALPARAVHVRSDVERKRMAGLPERASSDSPVQGGLYTEELSAKLYERLADCASDVLAGGFNAIVDATFLRRRDRAVFVALARRHGVSITLIRCQAPEDVLMSRIDGRAQRGEDASEATHSVLEWQLAHQEPVDAAAEGFELIEVNTIGVNVMSLAQSIAP